MVTFKLTDEEKEAMGEALQAAIEDQKHYLQCGGGRSDYGNEWPEVAARKADRFRRLANVARKAGHRGLADDCENLVKMLEESVDLVLTESTD